MRYNVGTSERKVSIPAPGAECALGEAREGLQETAKGDPEPQRREFSFTQRASGTVLASIFILAGTNLAEGRL